MLMAIRIRIPELLTERKISPYRLSQLSGGRVSMSTAYRLNRMQGRVHTFDADLVDALCDALQVEPGELFEREAKRPARKRGKE